MNEFNINKVKSNFGKKYGRLTIIDYQREVGGKYLCKCDCGKEKFVNLYQLKSGNTRSCGCYKKEKLREMILAGEKKCVEPIVKHGLRWNRLYVYYRSLVKQGLDISLQDFVKKYDNPSLILNNTTAKYINGEVVFMKNYEAKKLKSDIIIDGKQVLLSDIMKMFGIGRDLALKIIKLGLDNSDNIKTFINKVKGLVEYNGELYGNSGLERKHMEITGNLVCGRTIKNKILSGVSIEDAIENDYKQISGLHLEVENYIKSIYEGQVISCKKYNVKGYKFEIDIYLPDLKIGFEINGDYYHSTQKVPPMYHHIKKIKSKEMGIDLFFIWGHQWSNKNDIMKSIIMSKIGITNNKIFARKTNVLYIDSYKYNNFLDENHIQGKGGGVSTSYGIFNNNDLVGVMGFKGNELVRYATKKYTSIIGGFSKILSFHRNEGNIGEIKSYADMDIVSLDNNVYNRNGFKLSGINTNVYFYFNSNKKYHRGLFKKASIEKKFGYKFEKGETESEAMSKLGYVRCFTSGMQKWIYA